jgi:hypothetical protein
MTIEPDNGYLGIARSILRENGFATATDVSDDGRVVLLAENAYFVLAVAGAESFTDLASREAYASDLLTKRVSGSRASGKRWDAYVVLMASEQGDNDTNAVELMRMNYNTSDVRRVARMGVEPTPDGVRGVLRAFLPLAAPAVDSTTADPLFALEAQLPRFGVDGTYAARVIAAYRSSGDVSDV